MTRVFLTAPAVHTSGRSKFLDGQMKQLAADFGFTDMSNSKTGSVAGDAKLKRAQQAGNLDDVPAGLQGIVQQKMDRIKQQYAPPPPPPPEVERKPTPVKPLVMGQSQFPKLRPGPGTLRHAADRK